MPAVTSAPIWVERLVTTPAKGAVSRVKPCSAPQPADVGRGGVGERGLGGEVAGLLVGLLLRDRILGQQVAASASRWMRRARWLARAV